MVCLSEHESIGFPKPISRAEVNVAKMIWIYLSRNNKGSIGIQKVSSLKIYKGSHKKVICFNGRAPPPACVMVVGIPRLSEITFLNNFFLISGPDPPPFLMAWPIKKIATSLCEDEEKKIIVRRLEG